MTALDAAELGPSDGGSHDYVIVGSGAAGATVARVLADSGASVVVIEEGPVVATEQFGDRAWPALRRLYRDMGLQTTRGRAAMPVLQGSCLGGSTVVNSGIVRRLPADVWREWEGEQGLADAISFDALEANWELLEDELGVEQTGAGVFGRNNELLHDATEALGVSAGPTARFTRGCRGSARCSLGCPHGAKQSMALTFLPYATARGTTIIANARVNRVVIERGRAVGVEARPAANGGRRRGAGLRIGARKAVVLAASAIQTPLLLARSGVRSRHLGRHFQAHPGQLIAGLFDDPVNVWSGATQGYEVDQYRERFRCKIETLSVPPEILLAQLPGTGRRWVEHIARAGHLATWAVALRAHAEGRVRSQPFVGTAIRFDLEERDIVNLQMGIRAAADLMFAAGAREVLPLVRGLPDRLRSPDETALIEEGPRDPSCYALSMSHLFGTARMSADADRGVVGPDFAVHGASGLFVADSSIFPSNIGVNPQHTIMAVAMEAAKRVAEVRA